MNYFLKKNDYNSEFDYEDADIDANNNANNNEFKPLNINENNGKMNELVEATKHVLNDTVKQSNHISKEKDYKINYLIDKNTEQVKSI